MGVLIKGLVGSGDRRTGERLLCLNNEIGESCEAVRELPLHSFFCCRENFCNVTLLQKGRAEFAMIGPSQRTKERGNRYENQAQFQIGRAHV